MKRLTAFDVCMLGVAAASLTATKLALSWLANVELVTVLIVYYTLIFKRLRAFFVVNIFILVECFIYGFGTWIISYIIHWNFLVFFIGILGKWGVKRSIFFSLWATLITILFGVQTTLLDVIFFAPATEFFQAFALKYYMGLSFFITHVVSSFVSVLVILPPLSKIPTPKPYIVSY